ncbi:hypothetical protein MBLNU230_g7999t1 [Neophaeotheca triangularis]
MAANKPPPQLPPGTSSMLAGMSENLSFHASPETFIANRALQYQQQNPEAVDKRTTIRAKILNRNVAIVSSYSQVQQVLDAPDNCAANERDQKKEDPFVATAPYRRLMVDFFPPPNLLLNDGCPHRSSKRRWKEASAPLSSASVSQRITARAGQLFQELLQASTEARVDLYSFLKDMAWEIHLDAFLDMQPDDPEYSDFVRLQEDLLRGQFSLFPVTVNTGFWHSPRKVGIDARKKLQGIIAKRLEKGFPAWLKEAGLQDCREETVNHLLMSTSSLAVKGFASLMTAFLLNVFVYRSESISSDVSLSVLLDGEENEDARGMKLRSIYQETLRLSPPIVGVMRRSAQDRTLTVADKIEPDIKLPSGWDTWTYFPGANRDKHAFGETADLFDPWRYMPGSEQPPPPIAFGLGPKQCLGVDFVETACLAVLSACRQAKLSVDGVIESAGVKGFLGWEVVNGQAWARDMKQLPTQHPTSPIWVMLRKH